MRKQPDYIMANRHYVINIIANQESLSINERIFMMGRFSGEFLVDYTNNDITYKEYRSLENHVTKCYRKLAGVIK